MVGVLAEEAWPVNTDVRTLNNQPGLMMKHVITAGATFHNRKKPKLFENQTKAEIKDFCCCVVAFQTANQMRGGSHTDLLTDAG